MMADVKLDPAEPIIGSHFAFTEEGSDPPYSLKSKQNTLDFSLMGNFFISQGQPGQVLEVKASKRVGERDFVGSMRTALADKYANEAPVALGGCFLIEQGKAKLHIMPDFSSTPLDTPDKEQSWLQFFDMDAPLICLGVFVSKDPGLSLRVEHSHCFSPHGQGGHYHYDLTPQTVAYRGYFNPAQWLYRIDKTTITK